jgi:hypothetical protein
MKERRKLSFIDAHKMEVEQEEDFDDGGGDGDDNDDDDDDDESLEGYSVVMGTCF